jgi:hypothetical protein
LGLFGIIWAGFGSSMFPYCSRDPVAILKIRFRGGCDDHRGSLRPRVHDPQIESRGDGHIRSESRSAGRTFARACSAAWMATPSRVLRSLERRYGAPSRTR